MSRSDAVLEVECDGCTGSEFIGLHVTARGNYSDDHVDEELEDMGWVTVGEYDFCEECKEDASVQDLLDEVE